MNKFKFKFDVLLKYRNIIRDEKMKLLSEAQRILNKDLETLTNVQKDITATLYKLGSLQNTQKRNKIEIKLDVTELQYYSNYLNILRNDEENLLKKIAIDRKKVHEAQKAYIEADRNTKIIEKLKENDFEKYQKELSREETKLLDEIGNNLFLHNKIGD